MNGHVISWLSYGKDLDAMLKRGYNIEGGARYKYDNVKRDFKISFNRYFYNPKPLRPLEEIRANLLAMKKGDEG